MKHQQQDPNDQINRITLVLPIEARARLEQRRAEAELEFRRAYQDLIKRGRDEGTDREIEGLMVHLAYARFFAFAEEALNSQSDTFTVRKIIEAFLPVVLDKVFLDNHPDAMRRNQNEERGRFHDVAGFMIRNSEGWIQLQGILIERARLELDSIESLRDPERTDNSLMPETERAEGQAGLVARRLRILTEYMKSTGASKYQIYNASQHSCHKPEFLDWEKGTLPVDSATAQSLERFLGSGEKPTPRSKKPTSLPR